MDKQNYLERIYISILLVTFGGIVLQGPISVGFGTLWPNYDLLIKSWKEILMLIAGVMSLFLLYKNHQFKLLRSPIIIAIGVYATLHLILLMIFYRGLNSSLAGLSIDLRYLLFFCLVYIALKLFPDYRKWFVRVGIAGAAVVLVFALLQVFVLPIDILKYIGYNVNTISPYLTVDKNNDFIRINSTLRGPNPLGAYAGIILALIIAAASKHKIKKEKWMLSMIAILSIGGVVALWASYSRSALIGAIIAIAIILISTTLPRLSSKKKLLSIVIISLIIVFSGFIVSSNAQFFSNVLLHENPNGGSSTNSNEGHISSLTSSWDSLTKHPFGEGVGSTGSASLYTKSPLIIENQYLFTAHEAGWLGLAIFLFIFVFVSFDLWKLRKDWLALGVFASGISLAIIGLLLPVWVDDTVSIVWWGFAAMAITRLTQNPYTL